MIQELFGGSNVGLIGGDQRNKFDVPPSQNSSSSSPSSSAAAATPENLRCPRCDSSNTKFCYYNNYNLTQPRHFCKTCRRYWTKGGALRNVPIGGGCRKNKNATITTKSAPSKVKTMSSEMVRTGVLSSDPLISSSNPIIWASSQNSHFLSLLLTTNPNHQNANPSDSTPIANEMGLGPSPFYRNQALYGGSSVNCYPDHAPLILGNMTSATSAILDSSPAEMGFWNPSWPTDSAYPA